MKHTGLRLSAEVNGVRYLVLVDGAAHLALHCRLGEVEGIHAVVLAETHIYGEDNLGVETMAHVEDVGIVVDELHATLLYLIEACDGIGKILLVAALEHGVVPAITASLGWREGLVRLSAVSVGLSTIGASPHIWSRSI